VNCTRRTQPTTWHRRSITASPGLSLPATTALGIGQAGADDSPLTSANPSFQRTWERPTSRCPTDVIVQASERRVPTYTPSNPTGWKVESGNIGRHDHQWYYGPRPEADTE
jgi:hypothetical protein